MNKYFWDNGNCHNTRFSVHQVWLLKNTISPRTDCALAIIIIQIYFSSKINNIILLQKYIANTNYK